MALTLTRNQKVVLSTDTAGTDVKSRQIIQNAIDSSSNEEASIGAQKVAALAVDDVLPMGGVAAGGYLRIQTDKEINVKINDVGNTPTNVKPVPSSGGQTTPGVLEITGDFTAVFVSNPSAADVALVDFIIAGA